MYCTLWCLGCVGTEDMEIDTNGKNVFVLGEENDLEVKKSDIIDVEYMRNVRFK